jgi:hypothetical protein
VGKQPAAATHILLCMVRYLCCLVSAEEPV